MKGQIMPHKILLKSPQNYLLMLLACLILASCAGQAPTSEPTADLNAIQTFAVQTFQAALTQTQVAQPTSTEPPSPTVPNTALSLPTLPPPTSTSANTIVLPTLYIAPTITGTQYTPTTNPSAVGVGCNNLRLIADVTIPSGTVFQPNDHFTKTWKVENNGTCNWVYQYSLTFAGGER